MPIQIDELTADVSAAPTPASPSGAADERARRQLDPDVLRRELERQAERAARLNTD